jgi:hypothetical protein
VKRYLREPFREVVAAVRDGQRAGLIATDVRPELVLFLILGAGSHLFDVTALARESVGVDATCDSSARCSAAASFPRRRRLGNARVELCVAAYRLHESGAVHRVWKRLTQYGAGPIART